MSRYDILRDATGPLALVGDIGGTNARFALTDLSAGRPLIVSPRTFLCTEFDSAEAAIDRYLGALGRGRPRSAVIAVAGPVSRGAASFTNGVWSLSEQILTAHGFSTACLINDYAALALGAAGLVGEERQEIGPAIAAPTGETIAVIGAGTGFGVAGLAWDEGRPVAITTEGGHASFAPNDQIEVELLRILRARFGHVSIERMLSGPGLRNIYSALAELDGAPAEAPSPEDITTQALAGEDHLAVETLDRFCAIFGAAAGDIALTLGARGGVFLAGGIAPKILQRLQSGSFRRRFEAKGRFASYLQAIPTRVIVQPHAALLGAAEQLRRMQSNHSESSLISQAGGRP